MIGSSINSVNTPFPLPRKDLNRMPHATLAIILLNIFITKKHKRGIKDPLYLNLYNAKEASWGNC